MLEDYAQRHPSLLNEAGEWPIDLIHEEFHIRRQSGEAVTLSEYCRRFPLHADEIRAVLDLNSADASTSLSKRRHKIGFAAGETLADFDLLLLLGEGAFAQVFLARQISMQRLVALKISVAEGDEHKTLAQLDHPHIVRVFSQTVLEELGLRLLYMQYHPGGTLKEVVDRMKRLSYSERNGRRFVAELDVVLEEKGATIPLNSLIRKKLISYDWPQVVCWLGARLPKRSTIRMASACCIGISNRRTFFSPTMVRQNWRTSTLVSVIESKARRPSPILAAVWLICLQNSWQLVTRKTTSAQSNSTPEAIFIHSEFCCGSS